MLRHHLFIKCFKALYRGIQRYENLTENEDFVDLFAWALMNKNYFILDRIINMKSLFAYLEIFLNNCIDEDNVIHQIKES